MLVMAVAGIQNVPMLDPSILSDPRPPSPSSSRQNGNQGRVISRTSSILQMWRELEDECLATRGHERLGGRLQNESGDALNSGILSSNLHQTQDSENRVGLEGVSRVTDSENVNGMVGEDSVGSPTEQDDRNSMTSDQSQDLGEAERERVRQIFREWMNTGGNGMTSNGFSMNSSPRAQLLGRTELERIRAVREWIQTACEPRDSFSTNREEHVTEIGSQIERVRDGLVLDQGQGPTESSRRDIRRLCGRQALLDLLANNERERQRELQVLRERFPVSSFASRNRIQSILRIRLLHNRSVEYHRTNTTAQSELGFLRQRNTVSGLREGFQSRVDDSVHDHVNDHPSGSSNNITNVLSGNETQPNSSVEVVDNEHQQVNSIDDDRNSGPSNHIEVPQRGNEINAQGDVDLIEVHDADELNRQDAGADEVSTASEGDETRIWQAISPESFQHRDGGQIQIEGAYRASSDYDDEQLQPHSSLSYSATVAFSGMNNSDDAYGVRRIIIPQEVSRHEDVEHSELEEIDDAIYEQHDHSEYYGPHYESPLSVDSEDQGSEVEHVRDPTTHGYEQVPENEGQQWVAGDLPNEWNSGSRQEVDQEQRQYGTSDIQPHDDTAGREGIEQSQFEESWSEEPPESWLPLPSELGVLSTGRVGMYNHSEDGNIHHVELRELSSRRRVSSLLHSGFRESLDQLIQSYVERQSHALDVSELHEVLPPLSVAHDQDTVNANQNEDSTDVDAHSDIVHSTVVTPSHRNWEQAFHDIHWSRDMRQSAGTELEMINDLRIDMARLQQRLDTMQRMLESCMDKQLELQRSIRQEVSAALNRSVNSSEPEDDAISRAGSKWDCVRKGICCVCYERKIDSLLYRCGHMCTCAECASTLFEDKGKCPMCRAPVVEVIRAYTLQ